MPSNQRGLGNLDVLMAPAAPKPPPAAPASPPPKPKVDPPPRRAGSKPAPPRTGKVRVRYQAVYLTDEQVAALNRLSRQNERSISDLVREAVAALLDTL